MIKIGNVYYFMYIIVALTLIVVLTIFISKKEKKFQKYFIFGLLLSGFILHFLKLIDKEYYDDLPYSLRKVSFENICAVSTLIFPWLFFVKSNKWKDYMYCFGIFGGIGALIYPGPAINHGVFSFETIRCYYCHFEQCVLQILYYRTNTSERFIIISLIVSQHFFDRKETLHKETLGDAFVHTRIV